MQILKMAAELAKDPVSEGANIPVTVLDDSSCNRHLIFIGVRCVDRTNFSRWP